MIGLFGLGSHREDWPRSGHGSVLYNLNFSLHVDKLFELCARIGS
jgi:hypothetical protein